MDTVSEIFEKYIEDNNKGDTISVLLIKDLVSDNNKNLYKQYLKLEKLLESSPNINFDSIEISKILEELNKYIHIQTYLVNLFIDNWKPLETKK